MNDIIFDEEAEQEEEVLSSPLFTVSPLVSAGQESAKQAILDLQLKMATTSINHEYARLEFEDTSCTERKEDLLEYMNDCRREYFGARKALEERDPYVLCEFEKDLMIQKLQTLSHFQA